MLASAAALGLHGPQGSGAARQVALERLPAQLGDWRCARAGYEEAKTQEGASLYTMLYEGKSGMKVEVILGVVTSRLGALRDWSVASMGQGWELGPEAMWKVATEKSVPWPIEAGARWRTRGKERQVCINWYVRPGAQTPSFKRAELMGWADRLAGRDAPWGQMFVSAASSGDDQHAWEAASDVARRLAPRFYDLLLGASDAASTGAGQA
jgi:hypothetical protein